MKCSFIIVTNIVEISAVKRNLLGCIGPSSRREKYNMEGMCCNSFVFEVSGIYSNKI
jgi:hypothetical protein